MILSEIEFVDLQRRALEPGSFFLATVFKDFKKDVLHVDFIQSISVDSIKQCLGTTDRKKNQKFYDDGGLNVEANYQWYVLSNKLFALNDLV